MKKKRSATMRILSLMLMVCFVFPYVAVNVYAEKSASENFAESYSNGSFVKEEGLLSSLGFITIGTSDKVTRAEFAVTTAKLLGLGSDGFGGSVPYTDIDYTSEVYACAGMLCSLGVLSEAEYFYPDAQITETEATKIVVSALGYDYEARARGGWPTGYLAIGSGIGLTKCFDGDGILSREEFVLLNYEFMNSNVRALKNYGGEGFELEYGKSVLSEYHNIVSVDGYVEANDHSGMRASQESCDKGYVKIGGYTYKEPQTMQKGMKQLGDYLGYYVRIYVSGDKSDKNIYGYEIIDTTVVTLSSEDVISFGDFKLTAYGDTKNKTYNLSKDYQIIYNGVAANDCVESDLMFDDGKIELVKTTGNSDYNVVYVWKTDYVVVDTFVSDGSVVTDKTGKKYGKLQTQSIRLDNEDVMYDFIVEENGVERVSSILELSKYPTLAIWISKNDEYIKVKGFENSVSGSIEGTGDNCIVVSGKEYDLSDYAKDLTWTVNPEKLNILLTESGKVLYAAGESNLMRYGYLMKVKNDGGFGNYIIYMMKTNGEKVIVSLASKVIIDGVLYDAEKVVNNGILEEYQVIRYTETAEGEIKRIDTAQTDMLYEENMDPYNNLRNYGYKDAQWYGEVKMLYPDMSISSAIVFNVPTKLKTDRENYSFSEGDFFVQSLPNYEVGVYVDVYDITDDRDCAVLVRYNDSNPENSAPDLGDGSSNAVVDSVTTAVNEEGDIVTKVTLVANAFYKEYYFSNLLEQLFKQEGKTINPGDIVRYSYIGNTLTNIRVEFSAKEWGMDSKLDSSLASSYIKDNGHDGTITHYVYGTLQHFNNNSFVVKRDNGNLYLLSNASTTVMYYSKESNSVKPMNRNDLLSISNSSEDVAYKVVALTRYFKEVHIVVFYGK